MKNLVQFSNESKKNFYYYKGQKNDLEISTDKILVGFKSHKSLNYMEDLCDPLKIDARGCTGAPDIVVEILLPGNNQKELWNKYEVYEEAGVKEYWIISPQDKTFLKYTLTANQYQPSKLMTIGDIITTPILPGFELDLETVFAGI